MKIAFFYLTSEAHSLAEKLSIELDGKIYSKENFKDNVEEAWKQYDTLVFIMATGIVVRVIAKLLDHKAKDPAVIVIDQKGEFVISLLSGHIGGANEMAKKISKLISATPVITTATDVTNTIAFDLFAKENNAVIENIDKLKYISADLIEGRDVDFISDYKIEGLNNFDNIKISTESSSIDSSRNKIVFHFGKRIKCNSHVLYIRPNVMVLGVGCKKNVSTEEMLLASKDFLEKHNISPLSIGVIATIPLKEKETAIIALCKEYKASLYIADYDDIKTIDYDIEKSKFVEATTGVGSVSEASAYLGSNRGKVIKGKTKYKGITFALAIKNITYKV